MQIDAITLFPEMFKALTGYGVTQRAHDNRIWALTTWNPRAFTSDNYHRVDDRPYGGGPGMVMQVQPLQKAVKAACERQQKHGVSSSHVVCLSPQGALFTHAKAVSLSKKAGLVLICGRYEGIDERFIRSAIDEEISLGDYVVSGGELPAMLLLDAVIRLLPGVLNDEQSTQEDSFVHGLLDCPHYTRPEVYEGVAVPEVLLSGDHQRIATWRLQQSLGRTWERRPDLLSNRCLTKQEARLLEAYQQEQALQKIGK